MQTFNTYYNSNEDLKQFIKKHSTAFESKELLIQIFSGMINESILESLVKTLRKELPHAKIIGSTTDGEIMDDRVSKKKIVLSFSTFEKSSLKLAHVKNTPESSPYELGMKLGEKLLEKESKLFILFATSIHINAEEFLKGVKEAAPKVIVAGGLAGDNALFKNSLTLCNEGIHTNGAVGVSIASTSLNITHDYTMAWGNLGRSFIVNKSLGNIVYEIDGTTPYNLYKKYLGKEIAKELPEIGIEFPLIIQKGKNNIARAVLKLNEDGSMVFAGNIPEGSKVKFGIGNIEEILRGSYKLVKKLSKKPCESIFIYSCMARRRFLEDKTNLDIKDFSKLTTTSGFFTYGEFFSTKKCHEMLNESLSFIALSESTDLPAKTKLKKNKKISKRLLKQKAISHIINETSDELDTLNAELERKVQEKTEENLEQEKYILEQDKMAQMGEMLENIAHQWRQPLSAISSNASAILIQEQLGVLNSEELNKSMEKIIQDSKFLSDTIDTFRNYIKEDRTTKQVILQERIELTLGIISTTLKDCNIQLINEIDYSTTTNITLTVGEFSQVLLNIMNNAKDILLERKVLEPWVKINLHIKEGMAITTIEDNAGGIPEDIMHKIFDPYFTTKHQSQGTGIGLYMSRNIVHKHFKGELYAKNTLNGAKFYIKIPI